MILLEAMLRHDTFLLADKEGTDQTAPMRMLVCALVDRPKTGFLAPNAHFLYDVVAISDITQHLKSGWTELHILVNKNSFFTSERHFQNSLISIS